MTTFAPSQGLKAFLGVEVRNEADGGDAPTTLGSAVDSLLQMDQVTLRGFNRDTAKLHWGEILNELSTAIVAHGRDFKVGEFVDADLSAPAP